MQSDPGADAFEGMIEAAIDDLPEPFRSQLHTVAIVIDDEASPEMLAETGPRGLFGVYQGVPRTAWSAGSAPVPSKITIFRRPLEEFYREPGRRIHSPARLVSLTGRR